MEVKFRWKESDGEGVISAADRKRVLEAHWVTAADFMRDVIHYAELLYEEVLEKRNAN